MCRSAARNGDRRYPALDRKSCRQYGMPWRQIPEAGELSPVTVQRRLTQLDGSGAGPDGGRSMIDDTLGAIHAARAGHSATPGERLVRSGTIDPSGARRPRREGEPTLGAVLRVSACSAQASTAHHRPAPSRHQPFVTIWSGQRIGRPMSSRYTHRKHRPRSVEKALPNSFTPLTISSTHDGIRRSSSPRGPDRWALAAIDRRLTRGGRPTATCHYPEPPAPEMIQTPWRCSRPETCRGQARAPYGARA
jgi:hypothetical protein